MLINSLTPSCCDTPWETTVKILQQFLALATNPPDNLQPLSTDDREDLYRKILLTFQYI